MGSGGRGIVSPVLLPEYGANRRQELTHLFLLACREDTSVVPGQRVDMRIGDNK